jgi:hypothetical protein
VCREAVDGCDVDDVCDGEQLQCPVDAVYHCAENVEIPAGLPRSVRVDTSTACNYWYAPDCGGYVVGEDSPEVIFLFTPEEEGHYTFDTDGSSFDTALYAYGGAACDTPLLGCNDDREADLLSELTLRLDAGVTIPIALDGYGGASGEAVLNIRRAGP